MRILGEILIWVVGIAMFVALSRGFSPVMGGFGRLLANPFTLLALAVLAILLFARRLLPRSDARLERRPK